MKGARLLDAMLEPLGLRQRILRTRIFHLNLRPPACARICAQAHAILTATDQLQTTLAQTRTAPRPNRANLFEADFVECLFHRLAGDPDDSPERRIQLQHHVDCTRGRERADKQRRGYCRVTRREQGEAEKRGGTARILPGPATEPGSQFYSARPRATVPPRYAADEL